MRDVSQTGKSLISAFVTSKDNTFCHFGHRSHASGTRMLHLGHMGKMRDESFSSQVVNSVCEREM